MLYFLLVISIITITVILFIARGSNIDAKAQKALDKYLTQEPSNAELGLFYERYIGHLHELEGSHVEYHGAIHGFRDLGCDLIVSNGEEVDIIQTKHWAKFKLISEKHIFQLYGTAVYYKLLAKDSDLSVNAILYTSAKFSKVAKKVAKVLGVELRTKSFDRTYPRIKCYVLRSGDKVYSMPFDPDYDKIEMQKQNGDFYARTVKEAVAKGFSRAAGYSQAA